MVNKHLYHNYHSKIKFHKRIIADNDFTYRNIIKSLRSLLSNSKSVLDIGSATGTLCFYFASKGLNVDGVELSKKAYQYAVINKKNLHVTNVNFVNTPIENYRTREKYDLVTCFEVLEHLQDDLLVLNKINKMMKNNSSLIISVPSKNAPLYKLGFLNNFDTRVGHLRRYSLEEIKQKLKETKFKVVKSYKYEGILRNFLFTNSFFSPIIKLTKLNTINLMFTKLDELCVKLFGESQIVLICKKK